MSQVDEKQAVRQDRTMEQPPPSAEAMAKAAAGLVPAQSAGMPDTAQTFFAVVNADGTLAYDFRAVSSQRFGPGIYEVVFAHDLTGSAYIATIGGTNSSAVEPTGQITVDPRFNTPNGVFITTTDSSGTFVDRGFHIAVHS